MPATLDWTQTAPLAHPCYPHHFANDPLVPGALLLEWIDQALQSRHQLRISAIKQIKFLRPLRPGEMFSVNFTTNARGYGLTLMCAEAPLANGQVTLAEISHS